MTETDQPGPTADRFDVVAVGAGPAGQVAAGRLAEAGLSVALYDEDFPGGGSSGAAMGHLVVMDDSEVQLGLTAHSCARWRALASGRLRGRLLRHALARRGTGRTRSGAGSHRRVCGTRHSSGAD